MAGEEGNQWGWMGSDPNSSLDLYNVIGQPRLYWRLRWILASMAASVMLNFQEGNRARTIPLDLFMTAFLVGTSSGPVEALLLIDCLGGEYLTSKSSST